MANLFFSDGPLCGNVVKMPTLKMRVIVDLPRGNETWDTVDVILHEEDYPGAPLPIRPNRVVYNLVKKGKEIDFGVYEQEKECQYSLNQSSKN